MSQDSVARQVVVTGEVQGVFFRDSCRREAVAAGVSGWVRNRSDGAVEAWLEGRKSAVAVVLQWCRHGPPGARVTDVEIREVELSGTSGFRVR